MDIKQQGRCVLTGVDRLLGSELDRVRNKRVGILTNHTGQLSDGRHIMDAIIQSGAAQVMALFGPEHGFRGDTPDGKNVGDNRDSRYDVPVYSLYGQTHKPTKEMLSNMDLFIIDIQDIGARFYTFISTVALALEGAAEHNVSVLLLDRPNPIRGITYDGPVRQESLKSFVSWMPIPIMHGMTMGELVQMWNEEGQLQNGVKARLEVLPMAGWKRSMWYDETGLRWIPPSPNMSTMKTAVLYPGMCLFEGTSISEGRGTEAPFELIGAPWLNTERVMEVMRQRDLPGVTLSARQFTPVEIPGRASSPKYEGLECSGMFVTVSDRNVFEPIRFALTLLAALKQCHPEQMELRGRRFDILSGSSAIRKSIEMGTPPDAIREEWKPELDAFARVREKYLMY
jgi:uncharacterized protein YbbC (DUF1343 family)